MAAAEEQIKRDCINFHSCFGLHHESKLNKERLELFFSIKQQTNQSKEDFSYYTDRNINKAVWPLCFFYETCIV